MKKFIAILLTLVLVLSLAACGGSKDPTEAEAKKTDGETDVHTGEGAPVELEPFSIAAVEYFLMQAAGLKLPELEPDWSWELKSDYSAYADEPTGDSGHAVFTFTKLEGEVTGDEYTAWLEKVFAATAAVSQDGYNIIGYEFAGEDDDPLAETTLDRVREGWMQGWVFRYNDRLMTVYVSQEYDTDKESELGVLFYYDGVQIDVGVGMQQSWDDYEEDLENYFD